MYVSQVAVDLGACMEAPCTPLAARGRLVMFSVAVAVGYIRTAVTILEHISMFYDSL